MSRIFLLSVSVVLLALLPTGLAAAESVDEILERKITLNLKEAPAADLFGLFAQLMGAELQLEFETSAGVNFAFDEIKVRTALNAFCESVGCHWQLKRSEPPTLRFSPADRALREAEALVLEKPLSLDLVAANAGHLFKLFAELLGAQLAIDMPIEGRTVTIARDNEPVSAMLDGVCEDLDCRWDLVGDGPVTLKIAAAE